VRVLLVLLLTLTHARPVRTADMSIVVDDTVAAVESVTQRAESAGGYVTSTRVWRDGTRTRATLVIRVPSRELTSTVAAVRRLATRIEGETITLAR
jgi:glycine cleavage system regulatory protein